ncbi:hypothetical protein TWF569_008625 [Orbilia oligospora]|nr:hypothetical protein TWF569_008625 [Orbilia oligospora]
MNRFSLLQQPACTSTICKLQVSKTLATKSTENVWFREFENFPLALREQQSDVQNYERAKIAIIDTGITPDHPDQDMARDYKDFVEERNTIWKDGALHGSTGLYLVAKIALEADVYIDRVLAEQKVQPSPWAYPLSFAAANGHKAVVRLLLARQESGPNYRATDYAEDGRSPLSFAAANGNETVVQLLLAQEGIDLVSSPIPRLPDIRMDAQHCHSPEEGHEDVVKLLINAERVGPDSKAARYGSDCGRSPLSFAADMSAYGRTSLSFAAQRAWDGGKAVVQQERSQPRLCGYWLLSTTDTPLSFAAMGGHDEMVKILFAEDTVNPDSKANGFYNKLTLLSLAAEEGHESVTRLLLAQRGVNPDSVNQTGRTPLSFAAANYRDINKRTPLPFVAVNGFKNVVSFLLDNDEVHPDWADLADMCELDDNDPPADDLNGYGNKDVWIDTDGDGIPDAIDFDGNGFADGDLLDLNKDGVPDAIRLHGVADIYYLAVTSSTTSQRTLVTSISNPPTTIVTPNAAASSSVAISSDITVTSSSSISESSTEVQTSLPSEASITSGTSILLRSEEAYLQRYHFILRSFFLYHLPDSFTPLTLVSIRPLYSYKLP